MQKKKDIKAKGNKGKTVTVVKAADEFSVYDTLGEKADAMARNRSAVFMHNVDVLRKDRGLSQQKMCADVLDGLVSSPRMTMYKKPDAEVPLHVMATVAVAFGTTIEDLCGKLLDQEGVAVDPDADSGNRELKEYQKYLGTYSLAYFDTGKPLGENHVYTSEALNYAVITVYSEKNAIGDVAFRVAGLFHCAENDFKDISDLLKQCEGEQGPSQVQKLYEELAAVPRGTNSDQTRRKCLYQGKIRLTDHVAELDLRQMYGVDEVRILMHNRAAGSSEGKNYRGGLATMMSVSRGAEHMPCTQAALLARGAFNNWAKEKIASLLYFKPPKVQAREEVGEIISYMKWLYGQEDTKLAPALGEEDKAYCLESFVEKKLIDVLRRNYLSYYKISLEMDSDVYRELKQGMHLEEGKNNDENKAE